MKFPAGLFEASELPRRRSPKPGGGRAITCNEQARPSETADFGVTPTTRRIWTSGRCTCCAATRQSADKRFEAGSHAPAVNHPITNQLPAREAPVFLGALAIFSNDLAIDLGTANTCVFARGRGIVLSEPSIVEFNTVNGQIEAVGIEAEEMLGRTRANITAIKPMRDGVIADFEAAERMLGYFIRKAHKGKRLVRPRVIIGVPSEITQVERRAVKDSAYRAKASEVHLIEESMAAAIAAGMPITEASGNMVVDIGGGTTDIAVISLAAVVYGKSVRVAGNELDDAIIQHARKAHTLLIGERTAEQIKIEIGSAFPLEHRLTMEVKGRHLMEGRPVTVTMNDEEIRKALMEPVRAIVT